MGMYDAYEYKELDQAVLEAVLQELLEGDDEE